MTRLRSQLRAIAAVSIPLSFVASSAFADVAPPDDQKSIAYSFTVNGTIPSDRVVFTYPCSRGGAPRVVEMGKAMGVERHGGSCTLYTVAKTTYDDFAKTFTPSRADASDPKLNALVASSQKCSGTPSPLFVVSENDSRDAIVEELDITLDASSCTVASRGVPSSDSGGCSVGGSAGSAAPWMLAIAVPVLVLGSRRRRRLSS